MESMAIIMVIPFKVIITLIMVIMVIIMVFMVIMAEVNERFEDLSICFVSEMTNSRAWRTFVMKIQIHTSLRKSKVVRVSFVSLRYIKLFL